MNEAKKEMYSLFNKMDILIFCLFHLSPTTGLLSLEEESYDQAR